MNNIYPLKGLYGRVDREISNKPMTDFYISPSLVNSRITNDLYIFTFNNMCYNNKPFKGGYLNVDQNILKSKLNSWIQLSDRKYIKLTDYSNQYSKFVFDIDEWLKDGLVNCKPYFDPMKLSRSYKLSKQLPYMVRACGNEVEYGKYIAEHFKKELKRRPELRKNVFGIIEDISSKHLRLESISMFDYTFNKIGNSVVVSLKPMYVTSILAVATKLSKDEKWKKKIDFDKTVGMFLKWR